MCVTYCQLVFIKYSSYFAGSSFYMSSLHASAHLYLDVQLEWEDLCKISRYMLNWEVKLCSHFGLTEIDIHDITRGINDLELQRYTVCQLIVNLLSSDIHH